jgi:hypothetical protein
MDLECVIDRADRLSACLQERDRPLVRSATRHPPERMRSAARNRKADIGNRSRSHLGMKHALQDSQVGKPDGRGPVSVHHRRPRARRTEGPPLDPEATISRERSGQHRSIIVAIVGRRRRETGRPLGAMWGKQQRPRGEPRGRRWPGKHRAPDGASVSWLVAKTFHARDFIVTIVGCCWLSRGPREADLRVETWRPSRRPSTNQTNAGVINSEWQSQRRPRRARPR